MINAILRSIVLRLRLTMVDGIDGGGSVAESTNKKYHEAWHEAGSARPINWTGAADFLSILYLFLRTDVPSHNMAGSEFILDTEIGYIYSVLLAAYPRA